jgi:hypothetical protein
MPIRWLTLSAVWRERLVEALQANAGQRQIDQAFIDRLQARRQIVERVYWKLAMTYTVLIAALFLNAVVSPPDISISGLTAKHIGAAKEFILFVTATLSVFVAFLGLERRVLKVVSSAWAEKTFAEETRGFARLLYGDVFMETPNMAMGPGQHRIHTRFLLTFHYALVVLLFIWVLCFVAVNFLVYVIVMVDILTAPSLPPIWSKSVVAYAAVAFLINLLMLLLSYLPMPYRDYSLLMKLTTRNIKAAGGAATGSAPNPKTPTNKPLS